MFSKSDLFCWFQAYHASPLHIYLIQIIFEQSPINTDDTDFVFIKFTWSYSALCSGKIFCHIHLVSLVVPYKTMGNKRQSK